MRKRTEAADERVFVVGDYWLTERPPSKYWHRAHYDSATRQTVVRSLGTADLQEAKTALLNYVAARPAANNADPSTVTLHTILKWYWETYAKELPSHEMQEIAIGYLADHFSASLRLTDITPDRVQAFATKHRKLGHSEGYISRILSVLRAALKRAHKHMIVSMVPFIPDNQTQAQRDEVEPKGRPLELDEMARLFAVKKPAHMELFMAILLNTMTRPAAALELTPDQVDFEEGVIDLNPPGRVQTRKRRPVLPLTESLRGVLTRIQRAPGTRYVQYRGEPVKSVKTAWRKIVVDAGFVVEEEGKETREPITPYSIRHSLARHLMKQRVSLDEIGGFLGHKPRTKISSATTTYAPIEADYLRPAAKLIDAYVRRLEEAVTELRDQCNANATQTASSQVILRRAKVSGTHLSDR